MTKTKVTAVTVTHFADDGSESSFTIEAENGQLTGPLVSVSGSTSDRVWFRPESWPEVREQINGFMDDLAAGKAGGDAL